MREIPHQGIVIKDYHLISHQEPWKENRFNVLKEKKNQELYIQQNYPSKIKEKLGYSQINKT